MGQEVHHGRRRNQTAPQIAKQSPPQNNRYPQEQSSKETKNPDESIKFQKTNNL